MFKLTLKAVVIFSILNSCGNERTSEVADEYELKFAHIHRGGQPIDTSFQRLDSITFSDSVYTLNYSEIDFFDGDTIQRIYELPISNSRRTFQNLKDTSDTRLTYEGLMFLRYDGKKHTAYKYLFDDPRGSDEEMNYYLIPEYGIVIIRSAAWGSYGRLISNSNEEDFDEIFYLTEKIVGDFNGFYFPSK